MRQSARDVGQNEMYIKTLFLNYALCYFALSPSRTSSPAQKSWTNPTPAVSFVSQSTNSYFFILRKIFNLIQRQHTRCSAAVWPLSTAVCTMFSTQQTSLSSHRPDISFVELTRTDNNATFPELSRAGCLFCFDMQAAAQLAAQKSKRERKTRGGRWWWTWNVF